MFTKLTDFSYTRSSQQALGFYFSYLLAIVLFSLVATGVIGSKVELSDNGNYLVGVATAVVVVFILSVVIAKDKNIYKDYKIITLIIVTLCLTAYMGAIFGLAPVAYLTTLNDNT